MKIMNRIKITKNRVVACFAAILLLLPATVGAQHFDAHIAGRKVTLQECFDLAARQNLQMQAGKKSVSGFAPSLSLSLRTQCVISSWNPYNIDRSRFAEGNFFGFEIGVGIPLFYGSTKAKVKAAQKDRELAEIEMRQEQTEKERDFRLCTKRLQAASNRLKYYEQNNQAHSAQISKLSAIEYENGEISYVEYVNAIEETIAVLMKHADAINEYNQAVIAIQRLTGMM